MNKNGLLFLLIVSVAPGLSCRQAQDFYPVPVDRQQLRRIEPLELEPDPEPVEEPTFFEWPEKMEVSRQQVRAMALEHNLDLQAQLVSPLIADERINEELARFEWAFFGNAVFAETETPQATRLEASRTDRIAVDLGVQMPLQTGGELRFTLFDDRFETNNEFAVLNPAYRSDVAFSISQPLLRGAGQRANTHFIRVAQYQGHITDAQTKLEIIRVLAAVDRVYWRLYAARQELEVRRQEYELAQSQLERAQRMVDAGQQPQIEILRAQAGVAQRLEAIIIAENNLRDRQRELKRVLNAPGLTLDTPTTLIPTSSPDPVKYAIDQRRLLATALKYRMELLELEIQLTQDLSTIGYLENQALPVFTMDYTYKINGLGATRSDAYDMLFDRNFDDHRLGLRLLVPLGNEAARSRVRQAVHTRTQRLMIKENRTVQIELEVLNAIDRLEATWQRILAARQNTILAARLYEAEKRQFQQGLRTSTEVLEAQAQLANARSAEIAALTEYEISQTDLAFATGTILGTAKITW